MTELNKAYHIATTGRRGPVLIDLPMNIQRGEVENPVYDMEFEEDICGVGMEEEVETASAHILHGYR